MKNLQRQTWMILALFGLLGVIFGALTLVIAPRDSSGHFRIEAIAAAGGIFAFALVYGAVVARVARTAIVTQKPPAAKAISEQTAPTASPAVAGSVSEKQVSPFQSANVLPLHVPSQVPRPLKKQGAADPNPKPQASSKPMPPPIEMLRNRSASSDGGQLPAEGRKKCKHGKFPGNCALCDWDAYKRRHGDWETD